ncbi:GNAT family N-acetyltransferase [Corallococcus sp. M34]|nr:GNAT family N-acetyltransferase [Citreicoccus inhibens]
MGMSRIHLRLAREEDRRALWRIHTRAVVLRCCDAYSPREVSTWVGQLKPEGYLLPEGHRTVLVAERGEQPVGFGQLDVVSGELEALYVTPEESGRGVGTLLLGSLERTAWLAGVAELRLDASLNAEGFYQHRGYTPLCAARRILTAEVRLACVRMHKPRPRAALPQETRAMTPRAPETSLS